MELDAPQCLLCKKEGSFEYKWDIVGVSEGNGELNDPELRGMKLLITCGKTSISGRNLFLAKRCYLCAPNVVSK